MLTNSTIADNFSLLSKLMDIHQENSFKTKTYSIAAYNIEQLQIELITLSSNEIYTLKGIGDSVAAKIIEQLQTGYLSILNEYISKTPPGIIEMLNNIKGLGPKKISIIWKEMNIESIGELLYACNENRLTLYKGFGEKTQANVKQSIEFYLNTLGSYLYAQIENYALVLEQHLQNYFKYDSLQLVGDFKRQMPVIEKVEFVTTVENNKIESFFLNNHYTIQSKKEDYIELIGQENIKLVFYFTTKQEFEKKVFEKNCSKEFLERFIEEFDDFNKTIYTSEQDIFDLNKCQFIPIFKREEKAIISLAKQNNIPNSIQEKDITSIIHCHSKWSDGSHSIEEMVIAAKAKGFEFIVLSDHSKSATYAQGLSVEKVILQHKEIDALNEKYAPFKIFKSIESDILGDGSLDYDDDILKSFDCVIASIHSNLTMTEEKAMARLIKAIENPHTTILGHLSGRLLLSRKGYPLNYDKIIDACASNKVAIELNAHPRRLDIDWSLINRALEKNVFISINPDAHNIEGFNDCKYGVLVAQKSLLSAKQNLSSFSLKEFEDFLQTNKKF